MVYYVRYACSFENEHGSIEIDHGLVAGAMFGHATKPWSIPTAMNRAHM